MPILRAQQKSGASGVVSYLNNFKKEMEISSFLIGCQNIKELHEEKPILFGKLRQWIEA